MLKPTLRLFAVILLAATCMFAQDGITIRVDAAKTVGAFKPIYGYFGYDEPNFTYAKNGRKLVGELARLSRAPVYIRTHFMLTTGDGTPGFKFGSTNAYTEDASGKPVYDWTIVDRILDTYLDAGAKPFVEIGFMPKALSSNPEPYKPDWTPGGNFDKYYLGWAYPPKDYAKWGELVYQWVRHAVAKYGRAEVGAWYWEVWNEPDIGYWHGTPEEYDKLYDYAADGGETRAAHGESRRARIDRVRARSPGSVSAAVSGALRERKERRHRQSGRAARFHYVSRQGAALGGRRPCAHGHREKCADAVTGISDRQFLSEIP